MSFATAADKIAKKIKWFVTPSGPKGNKLASPLGMTVTAVLYAIGGLAFLSALINLWPAVDSAASPTAATTAAGAAQAQGVLAAAAGAAATTHRVALLWGIYVAHFNKSSGLIVLALLMGAIGGYTHALASLLTQIDTHRFYARNGWFYALRPLNGAVLGLLLYFAFRAGFANSSADASTAASVDPYGIAVVTGLAGLFASQALARLQGIFGLATGAGPTKADSADSSQDKVAPPAD